MMSRRMRCYAKGVFTTQTSNNFGYIVVDPAQGCVNNFPAVSASKSTGTGTVVATNLTTDPESIRFSTNSECDNTAFGTTAALNKYRVVAAGLRVRYIGTNLNQGGILVGLHEPDHNNLNGLSISNFDAQVESKRLPITRNWATVLYKPTDTDELDFLGTFPGNASASGDGAYYMGFVVESAVPAQNFEFEFYGLYEIEGRNVRGKVASHADPIGHSAVVAVAATSPELFPTLRGDQEREQGMLSRAVDYLGHAVSSAGRVAGVANNVYNFAKNAPGAISAAQTAGRYLGGGRAALALEYASELAPLIAL
jgi:hypothetical protein